jgi:non-ribosomal peptide synthetase component F
VSIPALFAQQAIRTPDALAVSLEGRASTYRELDEALNWLAHLLIERGVGPGECVALLLPHSAAAIVAMLKSGAAYLSIDPALPAARLDPMLADTDPIVVIGAADLADRCVKPDLPVADIDDPDVFVQPCIAPTGPNPDDLAHIIYTSGTTVIPKGVAVTNHNVTQLLTALPPEISTGPGQVWSQWHSLSFDVSVWEIWGATLCWAKPTSQASLMVR